MRKNLFQKLICFHLLCLCGNLYAQVNYSRTVDQYVLKGNEEARKGNNREAIRHFTSAINIRPDYTLVYHNRGLAFIKIGNFLEAIKDFDVYITRNGDDIHRTYNYRGWAYYNLTQCQKALDDWNMMKRTSIPYYEPRFWYEQDAQNCLTKVIPPTKPKLEPKTKLKPIKPTEGRRLALVVGGNNYNFFGKLSNALNDGVSVINRLKSLGFEVEMEFNADYEDFKIAIEKFTARLDAYDIGLFYYAGHGMEINKINYLIPKNGEPTGKNCIKLDDLQQKMEKASSTTNLIIIDACRVNPNNPNRGGKKMVFTLPNEQTGGSLIAFSTQAGAEALDVCEDCPECSQNSVFTCHFLKYLQKGAKLSEVLRNTRRRVMEKTGETQIPWESSSLTDDFIF